MTSNRPLPGPSLRTPGSIGPDRSPSTSSKNSDNTQIANLHPQQWPDTLQNSSSQQSIKSNSWRATSVNFGSKGVRHGSRSGADSEGFSMSRREINDDDARLVYVNDPLKTNETFEFSGNSIRTGKYSAFTFLPRNLFEQFHRVAYMYFLIIAILNQLPQLAVFGRGASILPLASVLLVTAIKDAYEDWRRHKSDKSKTTEHHPFSSTIDFNPRNGKTFKSAKSLKSQQTKPFLAISYSFQPATQLVSLMSKQ